MFSLLLLPSHENSIATDFTVDVNVYRSKQSLEIPNIKCNYFYDKPWIRNWNFCSFFGIRSQNAMNKWKNVYFIVKIWRWQNVNSIIFCSVDFSSSSLHFACLYDFGLFYFREHDLSEIYWNKGKNRKRWQTTWFTTLK